MNSPPYCPATVDSGAPSRILVDPQDCRQFLPTAAVEKMKNKRKDGPASLSAMTQRAL